VKTTNELDFGPVLINKGRFKGRIGWYEDEEFDWAKSAIVYVMGESGYFIFNTDRVQ